MLHLLIGLAYAGCFVLGIGFSMGEGWEPWGQILGVCFFVFIVPLGWLDEVVRDREKKSYRNFLYKGRAKNGDRY